MNAPAQPKAKAAYPSKAKIKAMVAIARELGLDVAGIEVSADGAIRVMEARSMPQQPQNDFDRFESEL